MLTMTGRPIAIVSLKCPKCGQMFQKQKTCYNRNQVASWAAWMRKNYKGVCPDCYRQKGEQE